MEAGFARQTDLIAFGIREATKIDFIAKVQVSRVALLFCTQKSTVVYRTTID
jgi:hypothetical protein